MKIINISHSPYPGKGGLRALVSDGHSDQASQLKPQKAGTAVLGNRAAGPWCGPRVVTVWSARSQVDEVHGCRS